MTMKIRLFLIVVLVSAAVLDLFFFTDSPDKKAEAEETITADELEKQQMKVILQLFYLDGEVKEEIVTEDSSNMEELWSEYKDWKLVDINTEHVVFKKYIDDISPVLKANGYFGLAENGTLAIFNGKPDSSKVIQSFYQIDMEKLEAKKQKELLKGIPVRDKSNFQKVLDAFKPYSRTAEE